MATVYIGIGSNLADPLQQVVQVIPLLDCINNSRLIRHSSLYQTAAVTADDTPQEDYINAVAVLDEPHYNLINCYWNCNPSNMPFTANAMMGKDGNRAPWISTYCYLMTLKCGILI